jgi:mRNA interferase RelE/StbE
VRVELSSQAQRSFDGLERADRGHVAAALDILARDPRPGGKHVKAIAGQPGHLLRYRVGRLRLIYKIYDQQELVLIVAIVRRRDLETWLRRQR